MYGSVGAGMLRGWIMLWGMELTWLVLATVLAIAAGIAVETVATLRRRHH